MPGFLLHVGATILCPHGGQVSIVSSNTHVLLGGQPASTAADTYTIAGCPFQVPAGPTTKPQPCVRVQWTVPATRVRVTQQPAVLQTSTGMCFSAEGIPQGPPNVTVTQTHVQGT
jgi:hypothetical protein